MNILINKYKVSVGISLILFFCIAQLNAQLSPGDLAQAHAHLSGLSNCTKCHEIGKKVSNQKCLDCHLEIGTRMKAGRGYHVSADVKGKECIECHSDHHGKDFEMIRFDTDNFNHVLTGYDLKGAHASISCRNCHKSDHISNREIRAKPSTYLGLSRDCLSCHTDSHQGSLSSDCARCHDFKTFRPAVNFNHSNTRFILRGKHVDVDCLLCHKKSVVNGKEFQKFTGLSYSTCTSCHKDVHDNKFGQNCTQCHSEASFQQVKGMNDFNHTSTGFPLEGKHQSVACASCHKGAYTKALKYKLCSDCHTDYHKSQFMDRGKSPDCSECHSIFGFERTSYTIERHNNSSFQLIGAHRATPCFDCHKKNEQWSFREIGKKCSDCHKNIHETALDKKYDPEESCIICHTSKQWSDIEFDHSQTGYRLEGVHKRQSCRSCHFRAGEDGQAVQQFSKLSSACTVCHQDVHQNQFVDSTGPACQKCHDYNDWSANLFDHNQTEFPLDGKHQNVACRKCHPQVITAQVSYTRYKLNSFTCESCH